MSPFSVMVKFWKTSDPYGEFSNFYKKKLIVNGIEYLTSEHYYQSKKFEGTEWEEYIRSQPTARLAAHQGRRDDLPLRKDWEAVKEDVMMEALRHKFKDTALKNLLLSTEKEILVEDSPYDYYWGIGKDGTGKNRLGALLMRLRAELLNENKPLFW